ncbi:MAG TPA: GAF domain-containing protein, partial [Candidatus Bathyarchaeia archaeon]|nr:GAF domain-containing protein [Candidatus Bathyarchaeia archaeon]
MIQRLRRKALHGRAANDDAQLLSDLADTQLAIETETLDLEAAMNRVVSMALRLGRATGAAIWLFTRQEFVYRAGAGSGANNDERLPLEVLSKLASGCGSTDHSFHEPGGSAICNPAPDGIRYPDSVKSLLVAPICQGRNVTGALAAFSTEVNAFTERDAASARLLSGLLTRKAAEAEPKQRVNLESAALLQTIDQLMPAWRELEKENQEPHTSPGKF